MNKLLYLALFLVIGTCLAQAQTYSPDQRAQHVPRTSLLRNPLPVSQGGTGVNSPGNAAFVSMMGSDARLPHWNKALSNVMANKGNARILFVGDSTMEGYYSVNASTGNMQSLSIPTQLANIFNAHGVLANANTITGGGAADRGNLVGPLLSIGTGWTYGNGSLGGELYETNTNTGTTTFTPGIPVDHFKFYYYETPGLGTLTYTIDSGSPSTINQSVATNLASITVSTNLGYHTLNFSTTGSLFVDFASVEGWDSTKSQVIIYNAGVSGATSTSLIANAANFGAQAACGTWAPDLVVIQIQVNDETLNVPLGTAYSNLQTFINGCQASGVTDIVLMTSGHVDPIGGFAVPETTQAAYAKNIKNLAAANSNSTEVRGVPVLDEFSSLVSYNYENTYLGTVYTPGASPGDLHMTWVGYGMIARDIAAMLLPSTSFPNLGYGAEQSIAYAPGLITSVNNTKGGVTKWAKTSLVDNIEGSAITFTCSVNPTVTLYECGTDATCASPATIGSVTVTSAGTVVDGTASIPLITAGDYVGWAISAGTCTALNISATAQVHAN